MGDISNDSNENTNKNIKENLDSINNFICTKNLIVRGVFVVRRNLYFQHVHVVKPSA